jgi:hypothetical protein
MFSEAKTMFRGIDARVCKWWMRREMKKRNEKASPSHCWPSNLNRKSSAAFSSA